MKELTMPESLNAGSDVTRSLFEAAARVTRHHVEKLDLRRSIAPIATPDNAAAAKPQRPAAAMRERSERPS
jgi:hypothetical protein